MLRCRASRRGDLADFCSGVLRAPQYCRSCMTQPVLDGKIGVVFGVANKRSIAWAIAQACAKSVAKLAFTYQGERLKENVEELAGTFAADTLLLPCDVARDEASTRVFTEVGRTFSKIDL